MADGRSRNEEDTIVEDLSRIKAYLESKLNIIDAHNVDFFTQNLWENCLPQGLRKDLEMLPQNQLAKLPTLFDFPSEEEPLCSGHFNELKQFLDEARDVQLPNMDCVQLHTDSWVVGDHQMPSFMMSPKKSHEVAVMAKTVNEIAQQVQAKQVLDLGSGKGYLSQSLAMDYGLTVIGVDSNETNTQNAEKRNVKLLKAWNGILRKRESCEGIDKETKDKEENKQYLSTPCSGACTAEGPSSDKVDEQSKVTCDTGFSSCLTNACSNSGDLTGDGDCKNLHNKCNCDDKHLNSPGTLTTKDSYNQDQMQCGAPSYVPVTQYIDISEFQSSKLFSELTICRDQAKQVDCLVLVGLHTCGDLAPTAIKIFMNDIAVRGLCLVGCCYHLLSQGPSGNDDNQEYGFPLSDCLRKQKYRLSRNATMVAQQAATKMATLNKLPPRSIFYRAVLQVILKEKFQLDTSGQHVGRIGAKCKTFLEYVTKGLNKLGLPENSMQDDEILEYLERFKDKEWQIMAFHQLRASIAPSIESLFLMDRLCYLREQGFADSSVVGLFDPVKSPRCYAIIATKESGPSD